MATHSTSPVFLKREWAPIIIFLTALALRLGYTFFLQGHYLFYHSPGEDVTYYQDWAAEIASGRWLGDKTFFGLPLFPYTLAVLLRLALGDWGVIRVFFLVLGSLNCVLVYRAGEKLFSARVGILAGFLAAANFILIYYDWLMMPVTLLTTLALVLLLTLLGFSAQTGSREWFLFGLIAGLMVLGDGKILFFTVLLAGYLLWTQTGGAWITFKKIVVPLFLGCFMVVFAVTARNRAVGGDWTFISAQSGLSFYAGNHSGATGIYDHPGFLRPTHQGQDEDQRIVAERIANRELSPGEVSRFWRQKGMAFITGHPGQYAQLVVRKIVLFFTDAEDAHDTDLLMQRDWRRLLDLNPFWVICPFALIGIFLTFQKRGPTVYFNLLLFSQLIMTVVFFMSTRHRATVLPVLLIYESFFILWFIRQFQGRHFRRLLAAVGAVVLYVLSCPPVSSDGDFINFVRWSKAGTVYLQKGQPEEAERYYQKALALRPGDSVNLYNLGNACMGQGDIARAKDYYQQAVNICPYNVDALFNLGYAWEQSGDPQRALQLYQQVSHYQPDSIDVNFQLAQVYNRLGQCEEARVFYARVVNNNPGLEPRLRSALPDCFAPENITP